MTTVLSSCFRLTAHLRRSPLAIVTVLTLCCNCAFPQTKSLNDLQKQIEQISQAAKGRVGATVMLLETGESLSVNGKEHFPMQSVYKFPIAMAVLHQVDEGKLKLEQAINLWC